MKSHLKYILPLIIFSILLIILKLTEPQPVDWKDSYSRKDKIPFGSYVMYDLLKDLFKDNSINEITFPVYNTLKNKIIKDVNYIIICTQFNPDELDIQYMLDFVHDGNNMFISASSFGKELSDSLRIKTQSILFSEDSLFVSLTDDIFNRSDTTFIKTSSLNNYLTEFDSVNSISLGIDNYGNTNFIKYYYGRGSFFIHTIPHAFSNYNILNDDAGYVAGVFSHLSDGNIFWDEYYKEVNKYNSTPLRFILSTTELRWSYFTLVISLILFIIFRGKREQRIIPVIKPLENTTVEFIETVGNLYFRQKNHKNIADKKIAYLFDHLRTRYSINTNEINEEFKAVVAQKTRFGIDNTSELFSLIKMVKRSLSIDQKLLFDLNNIIEKFYKQTGVYGK